MCQSKEMQPCSPASKSSLVMANHSKAKESIIMEGTEHPLKTLEMTENTDQLMQSNGLTGSWTIRKIIHNHRFWSGIWFALCTCLVMRRNELCLVFHSFLGCFCFASTTSYFSSSSSETVRALLGLMITIMAAYMVSQIELTSSEEGTRSIIKEEGEIGFQALAMVTGYLAFNLWHIFLHWRTDCCMRNNAAVVASPRNEIWENAITLSSFIVVLTKWSRPPSELLQFRRIALMWCTYKLARLLYQLFYFILTKSQSNVVQPKVVNIPHNNHKALEKHKDDNNSLFQNDLHFPTPSRSYEKHCLWQIHGKYYDLKDFVHRHPGGKEAILLGQGRDCTALFESYHPFTSKHIQVLAKYQPIDQFEGDKQGRSREVKTSSACNDEFYTLLKDRVYESLTQQGIDPQTHRGASLQRGLYYVFILAGVATCLYQHTLRCNVLSGSIGLAFFGWWMGALGHDAGHFAVSHRYPKLNEYCVWAMSLLCNPLMWQHQHTYAHHSHTNDFDKDPDLHHFTALLRVHQRFQHSDMYKQQRNLPYILFAYTFVVFGECIKIPLGFIKDSSLYGMADFTEALYGNNSIRRNMARLGAALHGIAYLFLIVVAPIISSYSVSSSIVGDLQPSNSFKTWMVLKSIGLGLVCAIVHIATSGLLFAFFSQINHLNEPSLTREKERGNGSSSNKGEQTISVSGSKVAAQSNKYYATSKSSSQVNRIILSSSWAVSQIETSNNFCPQSLLWHVMSNGLNLQIEHHLFPSINHCHLQRIQPIVEATCREFNISYKCYNTWQDIFQATRDWLTKLSRPSDR